MKTAYYIGEGGKVPAIVERVKRVYADVKLLANPRTLNDWEYWEVPIEDLIETDDFEIVTKPLMGDVILWIKR